ncbi:MAG: (E)-4-hydroxy-3-methylbut-2-enyl-diphosphate synthase [Bacteroidales bacterium]|nr:(E)-4-hydroxy-3-methylbut-2-enyl-diphosphate synthase [Bacteroidales bacterium]
MNLFNYKRRETSNVTVGNAPLGSHFPIRIQSMTNTSTMETEATIEQAIRIIEKGADYVRCTAQGVREAENLRNIREGLFERGYATPLIADIHFNPKAGDAAAKEVEKVRVNPGNYVDSARMFEQIEYTDEEYAQELQKISDRFLPFLEICKANHTAVRIGVNHGSLSDRIMSRYGDTPEGMVESCMEFLRLCVANDFFDVVISMKASNTVVMVRSVRWLVEVMEREGMKFPIHLGVTEAGDGEDGRIKSALGIGALLADGYGDTIRVSLSEPPENEVPVAKGLADYILERENHQPIVAEQSPDFNFFAPEKRISVAVQGIGGTNHPVVMSSLSKQTDPAHDYLVSVDRVFDREGNEFAIISVEDLLKTNYTEPVFLPIVYDELSLDVCEGLKTNPHVVVLLLTNHLNGVGEQRAFFHKLLINKITNPVIIGRHYAESKAETLMVKAAADFGPLLLDGFGDGIFILNSGEVSAQETHSLMFGILQAARLRVSKTEYISCPGCGRTLFSLEPTIAKIKAVTSHLTGLKIGIMGCIVNGPGEMADADYGYVGAGRGKISLYKGKVCIERNIPEEESVEKLIHLIKENGDWVEKV